MIGCKFKPVQEGRVFVDRFSVISLLIALSGQGVMNQARKVTKLKRFSDEVLDLQADERGIDSFLAIGAGENDFQVRSNALGLFKNLAARSAR
jgi:hypothetical protein